MERKSTWPWRKKLEKITSTSLLAPAVPPPTTSVELGPPTGPNDISNKRLEPPPHQQQNHEQVSRQPSPVVEDGLANTRAHTASTEETVKMLTQRILDISSRLVAKDELASQQARVAKEAVQDLIKKDERLRQYVLALKEEKSARENAEAGYLSSKQEFDKVCQQKNLIESRMMQLNGVLKESMDEMRHSKDQLELKTQEFTSRKREWDKLRNELEADNAQLKRQLMEATAENIAISKSLQERGQSLNEINETRSRVESESKILQVQIGSLHKDMDAYKYEIHVLKKELQIRNDEKEQNRKLVDASHKQHLESVKKIAKLDSECNRLRALVRKKLTGPAAIAQMRVEGDHVGKKRMPSPKTSPDHREMDVLTDRLIAMEDETKLLKESLAKKTTELQAARQLCARTATKLSSAEGIIEAIARGPSIPALCNEETYATLRTSKSDATQQQGIALSPTRPSAGGETMEVMDWALSSEDGNNNDDELSSAESWASALIAELSHLQKDDGSLTTKTDDNRKPAIRIVGPVVQDFDLQAALQELNIKLSSIGESILAIPSSLRSCVGEHGNPIESKPLSFGLLGQIMENFTFVKQLLVELQKAAGIERNLPQVVELGKSLHGDNTNMPDGSMVIDECNEEAKTSIEASNEETYKGLVRKVMEVLVMAVGIKQENSEFAAEGVSVHLTKAGNPHDGGPDLHYLPDQVASELLCKIGDLVKEHCTASWGPANVVDGQNLVEEQGRGTVDMSVGELPVGDREIGVADDDAISGVDEDCATIEAGGNGDVMDSTNAVEGKHTFGVDSSVNDKLGVGTNGVDLTVGHMLDADGGSAEGPDGKLMTVNCELTLQMELLQHEVERLSVERDELADKLAASEQQLEQQLARTATLDAESLLLASEKASLAEQLSDTAARNQGLEEDLAEARASLEDLRHQVSSLTSKLAHQAARCQELQGNVMALSDVGVPPKIETDADGKHRKEREIASAKAQLAECQRTILVLGNQLRALSSVQDHVAAEPSFDSSLESATSTDHINLPPMAEGDDGDVLYGGGHVAVLNCMSRRAQPAYVRTRGGRLVSAQQYWGSTGDIPVTGGDKQGAPSQTAPSYSYSSRRMALPRHSYCAACPVSPMHEYVTDHSAYAYSPPETALSSPASSPGRYNLQLERLLKVPPSSSPAGTANLQKTVSKVAAAATGTAGCPSPSPSRRGSRIARFFARAKTERQ